MNQPQSTLGKFAHLSREPSPAEAWELARKAWHDHGIVCINPVVNDLISRDRRERDEEQFRLNAIIQVENGDFTNISSTVLQPTPEQLAKYEFDKHPTALQAGTVRPRNTVKRVSPIQIQTLRVTGVLDDDLYAACNWYRNTYDKTGWDTLISSCGYNEGGFGGSQVFYAHLPKTQRAAESRDDFRIAQGYIPKEYRDVFNAVVIMDSSLTKQSRVRLVAKDEPPITDAEIVAMPVHCLRMGIPRVFSKERVFQAFAGSGLDLPEELLDD